MTPSFLGKNQKVIYSGEAHYETQYADKLDNLWKKRQCLT